MTLPEAIRILTSLANRLAHVSQAEEQSAARLGIEALKYVYSQYDPDHQVMRRLLPGETLD